MRGYRHEVLTRRACVAFLLLSFYLGPALSAPSESLSVATPQTSEQHPPPVEADGGRKTAVLEGSTAPESPAIASEVGDMMKDPYHNFTISTSDRDEEPVIDSETDIIDDPHVSHNNKTHEEEEKKPSASPETPTEVSAASDSVEAASSTSLLTEDRPNQETSSDATSSTASTDMSSNKDSTSTVSSSEQSLESSTDQKDTGAVSSTRAPIEASTTSNQEIETFETKDEEKVQTSMEQMKYSGPDESVTSPPVSALVSQHDTHDHPTIGKTPSLNHTTQAAAILAGVLVLMALAGYVGLLFWRRVLEKRYGNREMLVNEDDDFRHFEL